MKRKIVQIDDSKCNGCGLCVPACHEGAIKIVNGKARLSEDALCDGLGACLGECPQGAIRIIEREAAQYSEKEALDNIMKQGPEAVKAHLKHLEDHGQTGYLEEARQHLKQKSSSGGCSCPGGMARDFRQEPRPSSAVTGASVPSELRHWPVQLKLLNPAAPFFAGAELVVSADCAAFSYGDFHRRFLRDKVLVIFCPKLDEDLQEYVEKLAEIFRMHQTPAVTVVRMEVPCCGGTLRIVEEAVRRSGVNVLVREYTISLRGDII